MAHRDKSQSPEFTVGIDAKRTFVDKRSRPNLQQMTRMYGPAVRSKKISTS
jgi:hypothetical protein